MGQAMDSQSGEGTSADSDSDGQIDEPELCK